MTTTDPGAAQPPPAHPSTAPAATGTAAGTAAAPRADPPLDPLDPLAPLDPLEPPGPAAGTAGPAAPGGPGAATAAAGDGDEGDGDGGDGLGRSVRRGLGWSFLNNLLGRAGTFLAGIVLARVLVPEDYGVFAVALVAMNLLMGLNDAGMTAALIRWQGRMEEAAATAATLILATSTALFLALYAIAPVFSDALGVPEATPVVRLMAVTVIIDALFAVPVAAVTRSFLQGRRAAADMTNLVVSTGVAVTLALHDQGAWSLAWGRVAGNLVAGLLLLVLSPVRVRFGFDRAVAGTLTRVGIPLTGASLLVFAMLNVDNVIVGRTLGPVALGLYSMAFNLSSWPVQMFAFAVRRVSLAGFSRLVDEPARLRAAYLRSLTLLLAVSLPVCVLLATLAAPAVVTVYGEKWRPAADALTWLALVGIVRIATEVTFDYILARGRSRAVFGLQLAWVAALVPALVAGATVDGIRGVGIAHLLVALLFVTPAFGREVVRSGIRVRELAAALARPALAAAAAAAASLAVAELLDTGPFLTTLLAGLAGMGAYVAVAAPLRHLVKAPIEA